MIDIKITPTSIQISGHAGYDTHGKDIVCASVSAILQTAQLGLLQIARQYPGNVIVKRSGFNDKI